MVKDRSRSTLRLGRIAERPNTGAPRQVRVIENLKRNVKAQFDPHHEKSQDPPSGDPALYPISRLCITFYTATQRKNFLMKSLPKLRTPCNAGQNEKGGTSLPRPFYSSTTQKVRDRISFRSRYPR